MKKVTSIQKANRGELICPIEIAAQITGGKWKFKIIWELMAGKQRFGELLRNIPGGISQKVLTDSLRELEAAGVVARTVYPEVPLRVEYELSELGKRSIPTMARIEFWGLEYYRQVNPGKKFYTRRDILPDDDPRSAKSFKKYLAGYSTKLVDMYDELTS